jgi:hypothetical protein
VRAIGVLLFLFFACKPASKIQSRNDNLLQRTVSQEIGETAVVTKNDSKTFALAVLNKDESVRYVVIRLSDNKVVIKNNIRGTISWSGDMKLTEARALGIVKKDSKPEDYSRTIDLKQYLTQVQKNF